MIDNYYRKIDYLRVSVTDLCNFRCKYCMPENGVEKKDRLDLLTLEEIYHIVHIFVENGVKKIRITGGEPLLRKNIESLIQSLGQIKSIKDLAMTTNASLLKDKAEFLKKAGLDRVNISLDTLNEETFKNLTKGNLKDVKEGIEEAFNVGLGVKINTVLLKGINDHEVDDFIKLTINLPLDVRFIEVMPIGSTADYAKSKFVSTEEIIRKSNLKKIDNTDKHSPARMYKLDGAVGRVGFIQALSHDFCDNCNRMRLTADGKLKPCLHSDKIIDLLTPLRRGEDIREYIKEALYIKPERHHLLDGENIKASMNSIGG